ncbi:MAG: family 43 glycosylhydrolase [Bacteroidota bacterium]
MRTLINILFTITLFISFSCKEKPEPNPIEDPEDLPVAEGHYRNPITVEREMNFIGEGGVADPATFRWMGKYYLMTTQFYSYKISGFKVWESEDLVDWKFKTAVQIPGFTWEAFWSPEMYYYRGTFYIYFSGPSGDMALMKYEVPDSQINPEPFGSGASWEMVTYDFLNVIDHAIDGSILIEPNGDKYALFSGFHGVKYRKINSMENGNGEDVIQLPMCSVENIEIQPGTVGTKGWTEAPTAFKKDGVYYLTYTGNHFLRPDYQIHLAIGSSLDALIPIPGNPWILRNWGDWTATGNCYPILGPNLKDYYYTYHVKEGYRISPENQQLLRKLMVDKVSFESDGITTSAPTFEDEPIPSGADYENDFSTGLNGFTVSGSAQWTTVGDYALSVDAMGNATLDNAILSETATGKDFVAEAHFRLSQWQATGVSGIGLIQGNNTAEANLVVSAVTVDGVHQIAIYDQHG